MEHKSENTITFFSKEPYLCPVCESKFYREELRTGRGRLNAGDLTEELRRLYQPSAKFGEVVPLIYPVMVCPECLYAGFQTDFYDLPEDKKEIAAEGADKRREAVSGIFPALDYSEPRGLKEGASSYLLAMMCYDYFTAENNPVFKQGLSALRSAWIFNSLHEKFPVENYDYLAKLFYRKSGFFYSLAIEYDENGTQVLKTVGNLGPDLDKNYGYDGVLYISALLEYYYGSDKDNEKRIQSLQKAKTTVARIFGMGKSSKEKPGSILEKAKELHASIADELKRRITE